MRGVSVGVSAVSSAGGFVVPNDHVDVVLTTQDEAGDSSEVILANVRVLAIGKRLGQVGASGGQTEEEISAGGTPQAITFDDGTIATLELDRKPGRDADQCHDPGATDPDAALGRRFCRGHHAAGPCQ